METMSTKTNFGSLEEAVAHGTRIGEQDGEVLYHEQREYYARSWRLTTELDLDSAGAEAAVVLRVPDHWRRQWIGAYARAAARTINALRESEMPVVGGSR
jgi:hypothetical protein